jgi:hypothetical protein
MKSVLHPVVRGFSFPAVAVLALTAIPTTFTVGRNGMDIDVIELAKSPSLLPVVGKTTINTGRDPDRTRGLGI